MLGDTIVALASPPGAAERAVLRLSGPDALAAAGAVFTPALPRRRGQVDGAVRVLGRDVAAFALVMPGPHSYTGEDTVELHVPGGALLCELLLAALAGPATGAGTGGAVRPALPGEFTRRALGNGRLDVAQAEGVLLLIHADGEDAARRGVAWLRGGVSAAVQRARTALQDALALLEAGLDFLPEETGAVDDAAWQAPLGDAVAALRELAASLPQAAPGGEVLLLGAANAGKSSLCNALLGRDATLVDATPGTTRDVLRVELAPGVVLWDAPGDLDTAAACERQALALRDRLGAQAGAALLVADPARPVLPPTPLPVLAVVWTKQDLGVPPPPDAAGAPRFAVSARRGDGIDALRAFLLARCTAGTAGGVGSETGAAVRDALQHAAAAADAGTAATAGAVPHELVCHDLQRALAALGRIDGAHSPEDLLDRVFGRFCLGK